MSTGAMRRAAPAVETLLIGAAGAALFILLGVPAGAILGALLATATASLAGRKLGWPDSVRTMLFLLLGYSTGASVTPAAMQAALLWPLSIVALVCSTVAMWTAGWFVFRRLSFTDSQTAFYAAAPGALSTVLVLAEQQGVDLRKVAVAQSLRLLILICLSPLGTLTGRPAVLPPGPPPIVDGLLGWLIAVVTVLVGWRLARLLRWPAAAFLGAMVASIAVHASGLIDATPPHAAVLVIGAALGSLIGARFVGLSFGDLARQAPACVALVLVMALIGAPTGALVGSAVGVGPLAGVMAFAPGSMEVLVAVSLAFNAHPAYVAAHHLTRTFLLVAAMPALAAMARRRQPPGL